MFTAEKDITMPKQTVDQHRRMVRPRRRAAFGEGVSQRSHPTAVIARSACDEAIQSCCGTMDCFVACAPRNDVETVLLA